MVPYQSPTPAPNTPLPATDLPTTAPTAQPSLAPTEGGPPGDLLPITDDTALRIGTVAQLAGHSNAVSSVAFSPDGELLASGSLDGRVYLWDVASGDERAIYEIDTNRVNSVAFSRDGRLLAAGGNSPSVHLWEVSSDGSFPPLSGPGGAVRSVAFSPSGSLLAAGSDDSNVYLWNTSSGELMATLSGHSSYVTGVAFNADGSILASGSEDDTVRLWKVPGGALLGVLQGHSANVTGLAFSPDGVQLASAGSDRVIRVWNVASRRQVGTLSGHTENANSVAFSPDGSLIVSAGSGIDDNTLRLWDAEALTQVQVLYPDGPTNAIAFSPDGTLLASGGATFLTLWGVPRDSTAGPGESSTLFPTAAPPTLFSDDESVFEAPTAAPTLTREPVDIADDSTVCTLTPRYDEVNTRSGPGTGYEIAGQLRLGDTIEASGWNTDIEGFTWWKLEGDGWVRADVVTWPPVCQTLPRVEP